MSKNKARSVAALPRAAPQIHEASLGPGGSVIKGKLITRAEAEVLRAHGRDVVVCARN
jgi:hypothetical protein